MQGDGPCYLLHCMDKEGHGDVRARTREAHLQWLIDSKRVHIGGPLQSPSDEDMGTVGTLLLVNGDDVDEVREWATGDPYVQAGLFSEMTVAPLLEYNVPDLPEV